MTIGRVLEPALIKQQVEYHIVRVLQLTDHSECQNVKSVLMKLPRVFRNKTRIARIIAEQIQ